MGSRGGSVVQLDKSVINFAHFTVLSVGKGG